MKRFAAIAVALACSSAAIASEYPAKPIRIIAQFTPGSSTDILARIVAQKMSRDWNQLPYIWGPGWSPEFWGKEMNGNFEPK